MGKRPIIQLMGPTGVGKSRIAIRLAKEFGCEIISADSMQVYTGFNIGTDKLLPDQQEGVIHHLIDIIDDCRQFNAYQFLTISHQLSVEIQKRGNMPLVSGGTPLYFLVMDRGIFEEAKKNKVSRQEIQQRVEKEGLALYWNKLKSIDSEYAERIGSQDKKRIIRAFEIYLNTGFTPTEMFKKNTNPYAGCHFIKIGLNMERSMLYRRIEARVDEMVEKGLLDEVKNLLDQYPADCPPFGAIGYREMLAHLKGEMPFKEAVELLKKNSRNYAKRQLSWYRNDSRIQWFSPKNPGRIVEFLAGEFSRPNR